MIRCVYLRLRKLNIAIIVLSTKYLIFMPDKSYIMIKISRTDKNKICMKFYYENIIGINYFIVIIDIIYAISFSTTLLKIKPISSMDNRRNMYGIMFAIYRNMVVDPVMSEERQGDMLPRAPIIFLRRRSDKFTVRFWIFCCALLHAPIKIFTSFQRKTMHPFLDTGSNPDSVFFCYE